jgi:hypothetical protein
LDLRYLQLQIGDAPQETDLRGWEWRYLWQQCQSDALFTLRRGSNAVSSLSVGPDGLWVALGEYGDAVYPFGTCGLARRSPGSRTEKEENRCCAHRLSRCWPSPRCFPTSRLAPALDAEGALFGCGTATLAA